MISAKPNAPPNNNEFEMSAFRHHTIEKKIEINFYCIFNYNLSTETEEY